MKKTMIFIMFLASTTAFAQKFEIGAKAGVNISNFTNTGSWQGVKSNTLIGYHFGGFVSFFLGDNFAIQPEVLYSSQGGKLDSAGTITTQKVNYINVPVMLKYRATGGFYIEAGPQFGFRSGQSNSSINNFAKSSDVAIAAGIGYHSKIGLGVGARYSAGISKVGNFNSQTQNGINPDFKNGVIQLSVFYTLFNNRSK